MSKPKIVINIEDILGCKFIAKIDDKGLVGYETKILNCLKWKPSNPDKIWVNYKYFGEREDVNEFLSEEELIVFFIPKWDLRMKPPIEEFKTRYPTCVDMIDKAYKDYLQVRASFGVKD